MDFASADKIAEVIEGMRTADEPRARNRARINALFNGNPPWTDAEAQEGRIQTNVNFGEPVKMAHDARSQFYNAFLKPGNYFTVRSDRGPYHKRVEWSKTITRNINKCMKRSLAYTEALRAEFAQVVLHGIGPSMWEDKWKWAPGSIGIEDLLVPSRTKVSLENLDHFAVNRRYTAGHLYRMTHGGKRDEGWNMGLVNRVLAGIAKENAQANNWDTYRFPEKVAEDYKSNAGYYESDAVPTVNCWDFYFRKHDSKDEEWHRRIILDSDNPTYDGTRAPIDSSKAGILYSPKRKYSDKLCYFLHLQFGDGANVAPFRYHSIRSLGYLLYQVAHLQNRVRCKFADAVFESMLWYFRNVAAEDRERLEMVSLHHMGIIPQGLDFVPGNERYQVNGDLVVAAMSQHRQLMSENSSSFTQDINDGTAKELTATEVMQRVNSSTALIGSMLNLAYTYQTHQYREICRRFCQEHSQDPEVKKFRKQCIQEGVDERMFDADSWEIEPERTLGAGNKILEIAQADKLMAARNLYDPDAQREILHIYTEANTDHPQLAERLVPLRPSKVSVARIEATQNIAPLMMGLGVPMQRGINHIDYVETLLEHLGNIVQRIEQQQGGMADQATIIGLLNVEAELWKHIDLIAQDKNENERVKRYGDILGKLMNLVKAYAQRLQEQMAQSQGQQQLSPEVIAKIESSRILAASEARINEAGAAQKRQHKEIAFQLDQRRRQAKLAVEIGAKDMQSQAEIIRKNAELTQQEDAA